MSSRKQEYGIGKKKNWVTWVVLVLCFTGIPSIVQADLRDLLSDIHPYISVWEEFNSNIYLRDRSPVHDFITRVYPGLKFLNEDADHSIDLDFRLAPVFYAKETQNNYIGYNGLLKAWYTTLDQKLTFRVNEYLLRSEEPREQEFTPEALPIQFLLATERARAVYFRNVFEPSVKYEFGEEDFVSINYRNNIYEIPFRNSRENFLNPRLAYWFDEKNGIMLQYGLTLGEFQGSPDLTGHMALGRYTYRFGQRTSIFGEYLFLKRDFASSGINYDVQRPTFGIEHEFNPTLSIKAQMGYYWKIPENGSKTGGPYYNVTLTERDEKTTYTLLLQGGYTEDFFTAQNLGFAKYYRTVGTISHLLEERWTVGLSGSVERAQLSGNSQKEWIYGIWGNVNYQVLKWFALSLLVSYRENRSNIHTSDYSDYQAILKATATF